MAVEKSILGSILKEPYLLADSKLKAEHFENQHNKEVIDTMHKLNDQGLSFDIISILTTKDPTLYGGAGTLQEMQRYARPKEFEQHVDLLMANWREREKRHTLSVALEEDWDIPKLTSELDKLTGGRTDDHGGIDELLVEVYEAPWTDSVLNKGINTGLKGLQAATGGWFGNQLIIVAARPSMGKTDFMLHVAREAGFDGYVPIVFSLEMTKQKLRDRLIATIGFINRSKMRNLKEYLSDDQKKVWSETLKEVARTNVQFFDDSGQTVADIRMKTRKVMQLFKGKKPFVLIDYLTLIKPSSNHNGNKHQQVGEITKALKAMSKEFDCPVMCLAQLSRGLEQRPNKRPMLSDLRESGSIEEDADTVISLYRDSYYTKDLKDNAMELIIGKQREGAIGTVDVIYNRFTGGITDVEPK